MRPKKRSSLPLLPLPKLKSHRLAPAQRPAILAVLRERGGAESGRDGEMKRETVVEEGRGQDQDQERGRDRGREGEIGRGKETGTGTEGKREREMVVCHVIATPGTHGELICDM